MSNLTRSCSSRPTAPSPSCCRLNSSQRVHSKKRVYHSREVLEPLVVYVYQSSSRDRVHRVRDQVLGIHSHFSPLIVRGPSHQIRFLLAIVTRVD